MDPIDALAARLSALPLWNNGLSPKIDLPESAHLDEVVAAAFGKISFDHGPAKRHRIVSSKQVTIGAEPGRYWAAIVDTDLGPMIALVRYEGPAVGWWSRVYPGLDAGTWP
jgi:hypothetical protein